MRKYFFLSFLLYAAISFAQEDLTGMKFCIDPGHGNYPNDKPFETRINLHVVNYLKAYLEDYGAWVITTRQDSAKVISLYDRDMIANNNNVDFFLSVHHNATGTVNTGTNRTLMLYQETPDGQVKWNGESDVMCNLMADYLYRYLYTTSTSVRGDWSFYGSWTEPFNLGVLKYLTMPGVLSEASFWDFIPEIHRLNALGYLKLEAYALVHSYLDYYAMPKKISSYLEGVVEDVDGEKIENVKVTLTNGSEEMTYFTDSQNIGVTAQDNAWDGFPYVSEVRNGMYFFEGFPSGYAQLIFENEELVTDTLDVYVKNITPTRINPFEMVYNVPPTVLSNTPADSDSTVSVFDFIEISFSRSMNRTFVENAFHILPEVEGSLSWQNNYKLLRFSPSTRFQFSTLYSVQIGADAMDVYGFYLDGDGDGLAGDSFDFNFTTAPLDTSHPMVIDFFPVKSDTGILINNVIRVEFNKLLDPSTISSSYILLMNEMSRRTNIKVDYAIQNNRGLLTILPETPFDVHTGYKVTIVNVVKDFQGNLMEGHFQWDFTSQADDRKLFTIENFEISSPSGLTPLNWKLHSNANSVQANISTEKFTHGKNSLCIDYLFSTSSESLSVITDHAVDSTWLKPGSIITANIYADNSNNLFRFIFEDNDGLEASLPIVIDWNGWKTVRMDMSKDQVVSWGTDKPGDGILDTTNVHLAGFAITSVGESDGMLFVDDIAQLLIPSPTGIADANKAGNLPSQFKLYSNYPNPFNPSTTISFDVPNNTPALVSINIYDVMGRKIRTLMNEMKNAGHYQIKWDGRDHSGSRVASGVYFYRMDTGQFTDVRKMLFIQ